MKQPKTATGSYAPLAAPELRFKASPPQKSRSFHVENNMENEMETRAKKQRVPRTSPALRVLRALQRAAPCDHTDVVLAGLAVHLSQPEALAV